MDDLISRQAALDCFHDWIDQRGDVHTADEMREYNASEERVASGVRGSRKETDYGRLIDADALPEPYREEGE